MIHNCYSSNMQVFSSSSSVCSRYFIYFGHTVIFPVDRKMFQYLASTRCVYLEFIYLVNLSVFLATVGPSEKSNGLE